MNRDSIHLKYFMHFVIFKHFYTLFVDVIYIENVQVYSCALRRQYSILFPALLTKMFRLRYSPSTWLRTSVFVGCVYFINDSFMNFKILVQAVCVIAFASIAGHC